MPNIRGFIKVEQMAEDSFYGLISAAMISEGSGILLDAALPTVGKAYDASGAMSLPHVAVYCESIKPATPDIREQLYEVAISIIIRTSIREDTDKDLVNLYSSFVRFILASDGLAAELNSVSPNPSNSYKYTSATTTTENLEFKRVRFDPGAEMSMLKVSGKYYEITHQTTCLIGVE
jgi:hypothetical protein